MGKKLSKKEIAVSEFICQIYQDKELSYILLHRIKQLANKEIAPNNIYTAMFSDILRSAKQKFNLNPPIKELSVKMQQVYRDYYCHPEKETYTLYWGE